jgi:RNA polymerase sigma factor (sigma-70 family)
MGDVTERRDIEVLLAEARWLDALAHRLVRDAAAADDAVQEVWLAALERARGRARDVDVSTRGWLARVLGRTAARVATRERRRREREVRHEGRATDETAPIDDVVARAEGQRLLVEAVLALDEPYREVLLMRWFDELEPQAIAEQLGRSASTVRTQIERGLVRLRERLEARHPSAREWLVRLVPLALVGSRRGATDTAVATAAATRGAHPAALAAGGAVLVAGAALVWLATGDEPPPLEVARDSVTEFAAESGDAGGAPNELDPAPIDDDHREEATAQGAADVVESDSPASDVPADSPAADELPPGTLEFVLTIEHEPLRKPTIDLASGSDHFVESERTFEPTDTPGTWIARFDPRPESALAPQKLGFSFDCGADANTYRSTSVDYTPGVSARSELRFGTARLKGTVGHPPTGTYPGARFSTQILTGGWQSGVGHGMDGEAQHTFDTGALLPGEPVIVELWRPGMRLQVWTFPVAEGETREITIAWPSTQVNLHGFVRDGGGAVANRFDGGLAADLAAIRATNVASGVSTETFFNQVGYSLSVEPGTYSLTVRTHVADEWHVVAPSVLVDVETTFDVDLPGVTLFATCTGHDDVKLARVRRTAPTELVTGVSRRAKNGSFRFVALSRGSWTLELLDAAQAVVASHPFEIEVDGGLVETTFADE